MADADFFFNPKSNWQKRYEALRASFVDRLPARVVGAKFGYKPEYVRYMRHLFKKDQLDFSEPVPEGKVNRYRIKADTRKKIKQWREQNLSAVEITECLRQQGLEISIRTVERVLNEEGYKKLPRRTQLKIGLTIQGATVPEKSKIIRLQEFDNKKIHTENAGVFLFAPFIKQLELDKIVKGAGLPGSKVIPAKNYLLSFLSLKLIGTERYAHAGVHSCDQALGAFAGLNVLPKCTALSTYSYSLDDIHIQRIQEAFVKHCEKQKLYNGKMVNLDFHTIPHFGDESELEKHWAGARNKTMKGALTLFAQDAASKLMLYTAADIQRGESDDQVLRFLKFWKKVHRGVKPTLIFDSKFTEYKQLSELNRRNIKFITLRRRGKKLIKNIKQLSSWKKIYIPHPKRKFPNPLIHESISTLQNYDGEVREIIMRGNGHEKPAFVITNDFKAPVELIAGNYARRWRVENGIAEAVKFFNLNALSSPILIKVHFDIVMTMIADTLYSMLASHLRGFEDCDAPKIYRNFVKGNGVVTIEKNKINVTYPRRVHNPILRAVPWDNFPCYAPGFSRVKLGLNFR